MYAQIVSQADGSSSTVSTRFHTDSTSSFVRIFLNFDSSIPVTLTFRSTPIEFDPVKKWNDADRHITQNKLAQ